MSPASSNGSATISNKMKHKQKNDDVIFSTSSKLARRQVYPDSDTDDSTRYAKRMCRLSPSSESSSMLARSPPSSESSSMLARSPPARRTSPQIMTRSPPSRRTSPQINGYSPPTSGGSASSTFLSPLSIAVVCSSNQNRSMEAHNLLKKRGYKVQSFGTGSKVKLPGPTVDAPNIYSFDTSYAEQFRDLKRKDQSFYTQNGLLNMLDRNKRIKEKPEKFQENKDEFDLVITCQERVFDQVLEDLTERGGSMCKMTHVINVEIKDNHDDATLGAFLIHELVKEICSSGDHEAEMESILSSLEKKKHKRFLYSPAFY